MGRPNNCNCYCDNVPIITPSSGSSVPSSSSASSSSSGSVSGSGSSSGLLSSTFSGIDNTGCVCSVLPKRWTVTLSGSSGGFFYCNSLCASAYSGTFTLYHNPTLSTGCNIVWDSTEIAVADVLPCGSTSVPGQPRVRLSITQDFDPGSVDYSLTVHGQDLSGFSLVSNAIKNNHTTCLIPVTLTWQAGGFCGFTSGTVIVSPA